MNYKLMENLFNVDSPSGFTNGCAQFIEEYCTKLGYNCYRNRKGNVVVDINAGFDYTIGLSGHMDTLGLMVKNINSDGTLSVTKIGGIIMPTLDGEYCKIYTRDKKIYSGTVLSNSPSSHVYKDANSISRNEETMHIRIDENVFSKSDVEKLGIMNGDFICIDTKFSITESGFIKTRFLDDKASVFVLMELLKDIKEKNIQLRSNLVVIFSSYEEVGHGGANLPEMNELIAVDMGCIGTGLSCNEYQVSICAKDSSGPYDYDMTTKLIELSKKENIDYAVDIFPYYGSDASSALRAGNDIKAALIGPGIHASHGMERTHKKALEQTHKLLVAYISK